MPDICVSRGKLSVSHSSLGTCVCETLSVPDVCLCLCLTHETFSHDRSHTQAHTPTIRTHAQHKWEHCNTQCVAVCCSELQCVAVRCSMLQCVAVCCSVLHCVALCCTVLQRVAVCCSVLSALQCVAVYCNFSSTFQEGRRLNLLLLTLSASFSHTPSSHTISPSLDCPLSFSPLPP